MGVKIEVRKGHIILFFLLSLVGIVFAFGTNNPIAFGHTASEVHVNLSNGSAVTFQEWVNRGGSANIPTGTVAFFNLGSCPVGWSESSEVKGRYAVGLSSRGTLGGTVGTPLTNLEDRKTPPHSHFLRWLNTLGIAGNNFYAQIIMGNDNKVLASTGEKAANVITRQDPGFKNGTIAPYIQLLGCKKD